MKLIEAMKSLRLLEKRMWDNASRITTYASWASTERPHFGTEEEQNKQVNALVQANYDLMNEYLKVKRNIERTNLETIVEVEWISYTLSDLLVIKRKLGRQMVSTYQAMNDSRVRWGQWARDVNWEPPMMVQYYDEQVKNEGIMKWENLYNAIDSRLEVVNATTDLIE